MKVLVGLSGGVDSAIAALLLKEQGYEVIGATMAIWGKDGVYKQIAKKLENLPKKTHGACLGPNEKEDIIEAENIAKQLGIDFFVFDCANQYEEIVLKNFKEEYLSGRTPNPCIWCNSLIKFDVLPSLAKLNGIEFDKFATGHYANVSFEKDRYLLKRAKDLTKDQTYFLYRLKQNQLKNIIFPLGNYLKSEIKEIAKNNGLKAAFKPESQDFFEGDYNELLSLKEKKGNIVDTFGKIIGTHNGIWNYTIGQRKGLNVTVNTSESKPLYVIELKKETNEVVVGFKKDTFKDKLTAKNLNWIALKEPKNLKLKCFAKIRSSQNLQEVSLQIDKDSVEVKFENMQNSIALGQSIVFYDADTVLGGGIIEKVY